MESTKTLRINKALANAGICSRRKADELVQAKLVRVNGQLVTSPGFMVQATDLLEVHGKVVPFTIDIPEMCYLMLHKPVQIVSTVSDPEGRQTILDLIPETWKSYRLYPAGRLDYFSEGLILLTNDGDLTHRLMHPRHHIPRTYEVVVREEVQEKDLDIMRKGMTLEEGDTLAPMQVSISPTRRGTLLTMVLHQGLNRQIRRVCRDLGLTILTLRRIAQGPLELGDLPLGSVRALSSEEVALLKKAAAGS